jgi:hypothetical protein
MRASSFLSITTAALAVMAFSAASAGTPTAATTTQPTGCQAQNMSVPQPTPCSGQNADVQSEQMQLNSSFSQFQLDVHSITEASGAAVSSGNVLTVGSATRNGASVESVQGAMGTTTSTSQIAVNDASGNVINTATATGNGLTAGTEGGPLAVTAVQAAHSTGDVNATSYTRSARVNGAANSATAGANVTTLNATNGALTGNITQWSTANVRATAEADHCCVNTAATGAALASANNITATSTNGASTMRTNQRTTGGEVVALVDLYAGYAGDAAATATANGNALTLGGAFAPMLMEATQENAAAIRSEAYVTIGGDYTGVVAASSYGVGNSAVGQNAGGNGTFRTNQSNTGSVTSYTAISGTGGVGASGGSTAIGNMASGFVCTQCGDASLSAWNRQVNSGPVTAATTIVGARNGSVIGSATAIGNAATYTIGTGRSH